MKKLFLFGIFLLTATPGQAQEPDDYPTAGAQNNRSYLNSDAGDFGPPLRLLRTVPLTDVTAATSFIAFEDFYLVGEGGDSTTYRLHDQMTGSVEWTVSISGSGELNYTPAYANDIAIVGGPGASTVKGVRVSTGAEVWSDASVGPATGRHPAMMDDLAIYPGNNKIVAARASDGLVIWNTAATTAQAPVSISGNRVYSLDGGSLRCRSLFDGTLAWSVPGVGGDGSNLIATEKYVFVSNPATGNVQARFAADGTQAWVEVFDFLGSPGIALAYDLLFVFYADFGFLKVAALDPETGQEVWDIVDPSNLLVQQENGASKIFPVVANNVLYFFNPMSNRIRALDAFTGTTLWSILEEDAVHGLIVADGLLHVLTDANVDVYESVSEIYLAHLADGQLLLPGIGSAAASTLFVVNNLSEEIATGTIEFFGDDALPLPLEIEGEAQATASVDFIIPAGESIEFQSIGASDPPTGGWARVTADQSISGTAIFQVSDTATFLFEAGVGDAPATGTARVLAVRLMTPDSSDFSTGLALANPSGETADVEVEFRRREPSATTVSTALVLGPGEHFAAFLEQLFEGEGVIGAEGTLVINSDVPVVITALRTQSGLQMSSYPVGQVRR